MVSNGVKLNLEKRSCVLLVLNIINYNTTAIGTLRWNSNEILIKSMNAKSEKKYWFELNSWIYSSTEEYIPPIYFDKIGPVIGYLETLLGTEWWLPRNAFWTTEFPQQNFWWDVKWHTWRMNFIECDKSQTWQKYVHCITLYYWHEVSYTKK